MADKKLNIVGIGAHMDDCWLGFGGTALKAARQGHAITFITAVSQYRKLWYVAGREAQVRAFHEKQTAATGIQHLTLDKDYMRVENTPALVDELTQLLVKLQPDVLFCHDENETNQDHVALGAAARIAAIHAECFVPVEAQPHLKLAREIYQFNTGWQSRGFHPDVFVDVTPTAADALRICSSYDELYAGGRWQTRQLTIQDPAISDASLELTSHAKFKYGQLITCARGGSYTEGFKALITQPISQLRITTL